MNYEDVSYTRNEHFYMAQKFPDLRYVFGTLECSERGDWALDTYINWTSRHVESPIWFWVSA